MKSKLKKLSIYKLLEKEFDKDISFIIVYNNNINFNSLLSLKKKLWNYNCKIKFIKNNLAKILFKNKGYSFINNYIKGQCFYLIFKNNYFDICRIILDFIYNLNTEIIYCFINKLSLSVNDIKLISSFKSKYDIRLFFISKIKNNIIYFLNLINSPFFKLLNLIKKNKV